MDCLSESLDKKRKEVKYERIVIVNILWNKKGFFFS